MEMGDLKRVIADLKYLKMHSHDEAGANLQKFITAFVKKGAQQARVNAGLIKRASGDNWGIVREIFTGLKLMGLPRANKLIRSTLGVGPSTI